MKKLLLASVLLGSFAINVVAKPDADALQDIARHRAMAAAHTAAAQCLSAGRPHDVCQQELQTACKGLAIGKHCGMRHVH